MNLSDHLSAHFTLGEFVRSAIAEEHGIDNTPPDAVVVELRKTAQLMEDIRVLLGGVPIKPTSGYRCLALNRAVRSADTSQHRTGQACDFVAPGYGTPRQIVDLLGDAQGFEFDQLIFEFDSWVHVSQGIRNRHEVLIIDQHGTRPWRDAQ